MESSQIKCLFGQKHNLVAQKILIRVIFSPKYITDKQQSTCN